MTRRDFVFFIISAALVAIYVQSSGGGFPLDDSWIHQVYGRNLAQTGQWAFVPGEPSAASTSPLYTVLLSIGYKLNIDYVFWTHLLGTLALALAGMIAARLAEIAIPNRKNVGYVTGIAVIFTWHLIWAAASGMETMLFAMLTLALIWLAWRETENRIQILPGSRPALLRGVIFGIVAALATLARPEGLLMAGLAGLALAVYRPRGFVMWVMGAAVGFVVMITPYLLLNLQLTGGLLPNTAAAKQVQHAILLTLPYPTRLVDMVKPILAGGQLLLLFGVVAYVVNTIRNRTQREWLLYGLPLVWGVSLVALYAARLPASYQHGRYVIPALPALVTCGVIGTFFIYYQSRRTMAGRVLTPALIISTSLLYLAFALALGPIVYRQDVTIINEEMVTAANWIRDNLPEDELLAIHDIGAVGYFAPRHMLDVAGLLSPEVIPLINDPDAMWDYMHEQGATHLMAFPDQIPGRNINDPRLCRVFITNGETALAMGAANMAVYRLAWDEKCNPSPNMEKGN